MRSSKKSVAIFCPNFWSRFSKILFWYFWSIEYVWNDGCASQFWWSLIWPPNSCSAAYSDYWWKIFYLRDYLISSQIISNTRSVRPETEDLLFQIQGLNISSSNEWNNIIVIAFAMGAEFKKYTWWEIHLMRHTSNGVSELRVMHDDLVVWLNAARWWCFCHTDRTRWLPPILLMACSCTSLSFQGKYMSEACWWLNTSIWKNIIHIVALKYKEYNKTYFWHIAT